jgi:hypothetical protein
MSFKDIDKVKFHYLIQPFFNHRQLSEFFKTYWDELILNGVILKWVPVKDDAFEKFVDLPTSVDSLIISWLNKHLTFGEPEPVFPVIGMLSYIELNVNEILAKPPIDPELKKFVLSALHYLTQDTPPPKLLEYLRSPLKASHLEVEPSIEAPTLSSEDEVSSSGLTEALREGGYDVFEYLLNGEPQDMSGKSESFKDCYYITRSIMFYKTSRYKEAYQYLSKLSPYCPFRLRLQQAIDDAESKAINAKEEYTKDTFESDEFQVIAFCHSVRSKVAYLTPVALINAENKVYHLLDRQRKDLLFPKNGQLIFFISAKSSWLPNYDEIAIWSTIVQESEHLIETHAALDEKKPLHQVHFIEFSPDQTELIRARMKEIMLRTEGNRFTPIFCLNNQLFVSGRPNQSRSVDDNAFFANMLAWRHLPRLPLNDKHYVLGPLPPEDLVYNCAPVSYIFSSLLKNEMERVSLAITKNQISFLSNYLDSFADRTEVSTLEYIRKALDNVMNSEGEVNKLVHEMVELPVIKAKIDEYIQDNGMKLLAKKLTIVDEINKLQVDHRELLHQVEKRKKELSAIPTTLYDEIKNRFEKARLEGIKELSEIAFFKSFIGEKTGIDSIDSKTPDKRVPVAGNKLDSKDWLTILGLSNAKIASINASCELSKQTGAIVAVKGLGARLVAERMALNCGVGCAAVDMEVGINGHQWLGTILRPNEDQKSGLVILDANLSPLEIYGRPLLDTVMTRIASSVPPHAHILMSISDSPNSHPIPSHFLLNMVLIDLDNYSKSASILVQSIEDIKESLLNVAEGNLLSELFWPPLANRLRRYIEKLNTVNEQVRLRTLASVFEHQKQSRAENGLSATNKVTLEVPPGGLSINQNMEFVSLKNSVEKSVIAQQEPPKESYNVLLRESLPQRGIILDGQFFDLVGLDSLSIQQNASQKTNKASQIESSQDNFLKCENIALNSSNKTIPVANSIIQKTCQSNSFEMEAERTASVKPEKVQTNSFLHKLIETCSKKQDTVQLNSPKEAQSISDNVNIETGNYIIKSSPFGRT